MAVVNVRELARNTSKVISEVAKSKRATLVTRNGYPVAAVVPVDADAFEDWIMANAPEFIASRRQADEDLKRGRTISLEAYFASRRGRGGRRASRGAGVLRARR